MLRPTFTHGSPQGAYSCLPVIGEESTTQSSQRDGQGLLASEGQGQAEQESLLPLPFRAAEPLNAGPSVSWLRLPGRPPGPFPGEAATFINSPRGVPRWLNFIFAH